jgi:transcriptional regulator with XRE-family HTH domain
MSIVLGTEFWMSDLGARLREERNRHGMSQLQFAEAVGASKNTVIAWEKGTTSPNGVQLSVLADQGFDVLYILTGQRTGLPEPLAPDESALLENYRAASAENRGHMQAVGAALAQSPIKRQSGAGE